MGIKFKLNLSLFIVGTLFNSFCKASGPIERAFIFRLSSQNNKYKIVSYPYSKRFEYLGGEIIVKNGDHKFYAFEVEDYPIDNFPPYINSTGELVYVFSEMITRVDEISVAVKRKKVLKVYKYGICIDSLFFKDDLIAQSSKFSNDTLFIATLLPNRIIKLSYNTAQKYLYSEFFENSLQYEQVKSVKVLASPMKDEHIFKEDELIKFNRYLNSIIKTNDNFYYYFFVDNKGNVSLRDKFDFYNNWGRNYDADIVNQLKEICLHYKIKIKRFNKEQTKVLIVAKI